MSVRPFYLSLRHACDDGEASLSVYDTEDSTVTLRDLRLATALTGATVSGADRAMREHIRHGMDRVLEIMHPPVGGENVWRLPRKAAVSSR